MERIASFNVNHDTLEKGMYTSRVDFDDIVTYDIRMKKPNADDFLSTGIAHTMEHLFATHARNSPWKENILYVGPMGCRTGFYLLVKNLPQEDAIQLVYNSMAFISTFEGEIPGASAVECGNWLDQDLPGSRLLAKEMATILQDWKPENLMYLP